jgi:hypothetical protein
MKKIKNEICFLPAAIFGVIFYYIYPSFNPSAYLIGSLIGYLILCLGNKNEQI